MRAASIAAVAIAAASSVNAFTLPIVLPCESMRCRANAVRRPSPSTWAPSRNLKSQRGACRESEGQLSMVFCVETRNLLRDAIVQLPPPPPTHKPAHQPEPAYADSEVADASAIGFEDRVYGIGFEDRVYENARGQKRYVAHEVTSVTLSSCFTRKHQRRLMCSTCSSAAGLAYTDAEFVDSRNWATSVRDPPQMSRLL